MKTKMTLLAAVVAAALASCTGVETKTPANTLVVTRAATPPTLDGVGGDPQWTTAPALLVKLSGGANFGGTGETTATLKAVTSGDTLYLLLQYADPTQSVRRGPYVKQADGAWKKLKDANDAGGDDNTYYEDKWAIIWNIDDSIAGFNESGCAVLCHTGEGKPFGNKYTTKAGELGDMWHMKTGRNGVFGQVDDQYVDHTRYDAKTAPNAGRKGDPGGAEYKAFGLVNGKPEFMNRDGKAATNGGTYYVKDGDQVAFDDARFKAGDEVASYIAYKVGGDRGDIRVASGWRNGVWTFEVARKLTTGSKYDVQFADLGKTYYFGLAAFDNAQVRHAVSWEAMKLAFAR
jgi:hypothetical protein